MVHLLHSLFSVPVSLYSSYRKLYAYCVDLPCKRLPPVVDLDIDSFMFWHALCAVPRVDNVTHLERFPLPYWQASPCERAGKLLGTGVATWLAGGWYSFPLMDPSSSWRVHQHIIGDPDPVPAPGRLSAFLQVDTWLTAVRLQCGPDRGLCGDCVQGPCLFHGVRRRDSLYGPLEPPPVSLPRILISGACYRYTWPIFRFIPHWSGAWAQISGRGGGGRRQGR